MIQAKERDRVVRREKRVERGDTGGETEERTWRDRKMRDRDS